MAVLPKSISGFFSANILMFFNQKVFLIRGWGLKRPVAKRVVVDSEFAFGAGPALDVEGTRRHDPAGTSAGCGARRGERERGGGGERERERRKT